MKYLTYKQYYRVLLKERIKALITMIFFMGIVILSPLWLCYIVISEEDIPDKLNACLKTHDLDYCNNNVK